MNRFIAALLDEAIDRFEETRWKGDLLLSFPPLYRTAAKERYGDSADDASKWIIR